MQDDIQRQIGEYYTQKIRAHGTTARGVDWNSEESQTLRFDQLLRIAEGDAAFSINEIGCGYGALVDHLRQRGPDIDYHGVDFSSDMVVAAMTQHAGDPHATFAASHRPDQARDYCVASGIFNVRLEIPDDRWLAGMLDTLDMMHEMSTKGFSFNALTSYSDADKMRDYLYYADPLRIFDHCKRRYSRHVALLHDYGLYEFTILTRREAFP